MSPRLQFLVILVIFPFFTYSDQMIELYNRFDYGAAGEVEIHPLKGLLIGARMNISFGKLYKDPATTEETPNFFPKVDAKNNVVQIFVGYRF